jgi:4-hydroxybenzoate polyprenyltransferase
MKTGGLNKIYHALRFSNWWQYKIPPLIAIFIFAAAASAGQGNEILLQQFLLLFLWMVSAASFGYYVNDFSDIEEDNLAGKQNLVQVLEYPKRILAFFALGALTLAIQLLLNPVFSIPFLLSVAHLGFFVLYSVRPVRLKEKFILGAVCDALYAHLLPAVIVFTTVVKGINQSSVVWLLLLLCLWQLLQGGRNILLHHISDIGNDQKSATNNLAIRFGALRINNVANYIIAPVETVLAVLFIYMVSPPLLFYALATYALVWILRIILSSGGKQFYNDLNSQNITLWLLNGFYEQILPPVTIVWFALKTGLGAIATLLLLVFYFSLFPVFIKQFVNGVSISAFNNIKPLFDGIKTAMVKIWYFRFTLKRFFFDTPRAFIISSYYKYIVNTYWKIVTAYWKWYAAYWKRQHENNPNIRYHFCTVSNSDYLHRVLALHQSLNKQTIKARLHVLVCDDGVFDKSKFPDTILFYTPDQLKGEPYATEILTKYNDERDKLRWCLKPIFMHYLLDKGIADSVLYVDNDVFFFQPFFNLYDYVGTCGVWLTPHWRCMNPFEDAHVFKDSFKDGMYNAGFVGASRNGKNMLEWWAMANSWACEKNRPEGLWDDQKYLDMLPVRFANVGVVRHMGCNVAVWNKRDCKRTVKGGSVEINNEYPIVFIHFTNDTMDDIEFDKYGGDPLLKPFLQEYKQSIAHFKQLLSATTA